MYGYIYLTTNLINNKKYIGQHKSSELDESYKGSGKVLLQALDKYGHENFKCEILTWCKSKKELDEQEEFYIDLYNCVESDEFYNLKPGGVGKSESGLTYIRNKDTGKCKKVKGDELEQLLDTGSWMIGGPIPTQETINKRAQSNRGKKRTHEQRQNISNSHSKVPLSESHKQSLRKPKSKPNWKKDLISMCKDDEYIFVTIDQVDYYKSVGYIAKGKPKSNEHHQNVSKGKKGKIAIVNDNNQIKYVDETLFIEEYVKYGWKRVKKEKKIK